MVKLKRNLLSVSLASAMTLVATGAYAQSAQEPVGATTTTAGDDAVELDRVRVVGIRRGIEDAIDVKQSSSSIVEAISAEDIGKLPDTSIADSLARLPGLTAQRFGSRPQEINIRGFAGDFSTTLLNGREQVSLGNNRGVEFDQYPSELISQVIVYKTPDASLIGQGLSGTVDLQTVRPLSFGERAVAVNVRGDMNKLGDEKEYGNRYSVSYIDQFADNTVGLALGYAHLNNPGQGKQFGDAWGYDGSGLYGGGKLYDLDNTNERDGLMAVLEFQPNDQYHSVLDVFYSKFDKEEDKRGMEYGAAFSGATLVSRSDNANGTAIQALWTGINPVIRNDFNAAYDDLFAIGWNNELQLNDNWKFVADISNSSATRNERILETYAGVSPALPRDTLAILFNPDGYFETDFGYDYGDPSILRLGDAGGWGQDGYIKDFEVKDELTSLRFDFERSFDQGVLSTLEFGANLTDRTKSRSSNEAFLDLTACLGGVSPSCADGFSAPIPTGLATTSALNFGGVPSIYGYDPLAALNQGIYTRRFNVNSDISTKNWEVNEKVTTAYIQANINTDIGPVPVRGNVGVQAVYVDQSSTGQETFPGNGAGRTSTDGANYAEYLPSLNLSFTLPADQVIRVGAGRQVARPRMDDLRANSNITLETSRATNPVTREPNVVNPATGRLTTFWQRDGGNPQLMPWLADALDVSYEKYFGGNRGYFSAAYFHKDLQTYIFRQTDLFDITETTLTPADYPTGADIPPGNIGAFTQPANGEGGTIEGFEYAISVPFDLLWAPLEGFGLVGNYSDTKSSIQPNPDDPAEPLPGLSKYVSNITVYYERYGFSTRVSQRRRSAFLGEVQGFGGDRTKRVFEGESVIDLQMGYTIQSGPLQDLSLLLQVNNVENEPFRSTFGQPDRPREYFEYGRTYLLGLNYRF